jgi:hypothetical protein
LKFKVYTDNAAKEDNFLSLDTLLTQVLVLTETDQKQSNDISKLIAAILTTNEKLAVLTQTIRQSHRIGVEVSMEDVVQLGSETNHKNIYKASGGDVTEMVQTEDKDVDRADDSLNCDVKELPTAACTNETLKDRIASSKSSEEFSDEAHRSFDRTYDNQSGKTVSSDSGLGGDTGLDVSEEEDKVLNQQRVDKEAKDSENISPDQDSDCCIVNNGNNPSKSPSGIDMMGTQSMDKNRKDSLERSNIRDPKPMEEILTRIEITRKLKRKRTQRDFDNRFIILNEESQSNIKHNVVRTDEGETGDVSRRTSKQEVESHDKEKLGVKVERQLTANGIICFGISRTSSHFGDKFNFILVTHANFQVI